MDDKISTRDRILKAATRLFQLKGYHATGLNEILRESNAPKGSLYYYFPNGKEQLALESIELTKIFVEETIREKLSKIQDPVESIKNAIQEMADNLDMEENEKISLKSTKKVSVNLMALETFSSSENLRKACKSAFDAWERVYAEKLIQGGFSKEKAEALSTVIQSMIEGAIVLSITRKSDKPFFEVAKAIPSILKQ
ncbi:MAG: TetR/AcrR family transcriptional regulator [Methanobacterium sp.]|jgi:TetR/AcrR family transcriptional repressor of lmrAB and yxaGH operons|nr:TetR/AcrR family transcriptional regulator [Methanobacterium sp.]